MKKILFAGLMIAALYTQGAESGIAGRFELCCPLEDAPEKGNAGRLKIPGEVFDQARNFPVDLRLLDENEVQWPFFILTPVDRTLSQQRTPERLNKAFVGGSEPHWAFDLVMPEKGDIPVHNRLEINTSGGDFVRRVEVFRDTGNGSPPHLASGYLICFPNNRNARNNTVSYPDSDAVRLHVKVYTSAKNADETFDVRNVLVYCRNKIPAEREQVVAAYCSVPDKETDDQTQTFIFDTGFKNRPTEFITFDVTNTAFVRCVSVSGRNAENEPWRSVGGGEIHRLEKDVETTVRVRAACRWVKVDIRNADNLPLDIREISLEAVPRYVVFEAASDCPARLCFRGWDVTSASYDFRKRIQESAALALPLYAIGPAKPNPLGSSFTFRKYFRLAAPVAIGAVSLLTVWIIISMMRRQPDS